MTVAALGASMPMSELVEWEAFLTLEPKLESEAKIEQEQRELAAKLTGAMKQEQAKRGS